MSEPHPQPTVFTPQQANALLPEVQQRLKTLRRHMTQVLAQEAQADTLELVHGSTQHAAYQRHLHTVEGARHEAQRAWQAFEQLGCVLKDVDRGLVDFYARMHGELVFLCWEEGEPSVRYWHHLDAGYQGRYPIPAEIV